MILYALNNKGTALDNLGRYQEAIEYYDKALAQESAVTGASYNNNNANDIDRIGTQLNTEVITIPN